MIRQGEIMPLLLRACPSFTDRWTEFVEEDAELAGLTYLALSAFAGHVIGLAEDGRTSEFPAIFDLIECLHIDGDRYVRETATIGFLEDLQYFSKQSRIDPERFVVWLKPESLRWWRGLLLFWKGQTKVVEPADG